MCDFEAEYLLVSVMKVEFAVSSPRHFFFALAEYTTSRDIHIQVVKLKDVGMAVGSANDLALRCFRPLIVTLAVSRSGAPERRYSAVKSMSRLFIDHHLISSNTHSDRSMKAQRSILARRRVRFVAGRVRTDLHHLLRTD